MSGNGVMRVSTGGLVYTVTPDFFASETQFVLFRGQVVNHPSNQPIRSRFWIRLLRQDGSGWSDPWLRIIKRMNGHFALIASKLALDAVNNNSPLNLQIEATAEGYKTSYRAISIANTNTTSLTIPLTVLD